MQQIYPTFDRLPRLSLPPLPPLLVTGAFFASVDAFLQVWFNPAVETVTYIALGSNLGDRELNLLLAVAELGKTPGCRVTALSRFYETSPIGMASDTPAFVNAVARLATTLTPGDLLKELQRIERERFGRTPSGHPVSRRMDLDLLLYGDNQLETPELIIPHPRMTTRRFVLLPLSDIADDLREPVSKRTITELLTDLQSDDRVTPLE